MPPRAGFTLIEVIVAIMVIALGALALGAYTGLTTQSIYREKEINAATLVGREQMDSLRARAFSDLIVEQRTFTRRIGQFQLSVVAQTDSLKPDLKTVSVKVNDSKGRLVQKFKTSIYKPPLR